MWGSKRTGPDLHRVGPKYPALWHAQHLMDPRSTSPGSNMPAYAFLKDATVDDAAAAAHVDAMRTLGVPYTQGLDVAGAMDAQQQALADELKGGGFDVDKDSEMVALIAYLRSLSQPSSFGLAASAGER